MRILHVVLSLDAGGLEQVALGLARTARVSGEESGVLCLDHSGVLADALAAERIPCWFPESAEAGERAVADRALLRRSLADFSTDVIHTHQIGALYRIGKIAKFDHRLPIIHTEHGNHLARPGTLWRRLKNRWIWGRSAQFCDTFCCVSEEIRQSVVARGGVPTHKACVVPNGVDTTVAPAPECVETIRTSLGLDASHLVVGCLGRLAEVKRLDVLLESFAIVSRELDAARLVVVGDGPTRTALEAQAHRLGIADRVRFVGYQKKSHEYLALFHVLALTSESEGMPMAILEAFAQKVPVVASRVGAIPDVVTDGQSGYLVPFGDVQLVANRLLSVLKDEPLRQRLADSGRRIVVERFGQQAMYARYRGLAAGLLTTSRADR